MNSEILKNRTQKLAISIALFCETLPQRDCFRTYSRQLYRCSSSVGANYRAACRGKSTADFINKLKIVEEECDESMYFLELIILLDVSLQNTTKPLLKEANEILSIIVSSINTSRKNRKSYVKSI